MGVEIMDLQYSKAHDLKKLYNELLEEKAITKNDGVYDFYDTIILDVDNVNKSLIENVISKHNP